MYIFVIPIKNSYFILCNITKINKSLLLRLTNRHKSIIMKMQSTNVYLITERVIELYKNLIAEIAARKMSKVKIAEEMKISRHTLDNKLFGKSEFTPSEVFFINKKFFPECDERELFRKEG